MFNFKIDAIMIESNATATINGKMFTRKIEIVASGENLGIYNVYIDGLRVPTDFESVKAAASYAQGYTDALTNITANFGAFGAI